MDGLIQCACALGDNQMQEVFSCNIGIIRGRKQFEGIVRDTVLSSDT